MQLTIVQTALFDSEWRSLGLNDEHLQVLEQRLVEQAASGPLIRGGGGIRKIRFALPGKGKSGGVRIIYALFVSHSTVLLIMVFAKNEQANLTKTQLLICADLVKAFRHAMNEESR